MAAEQLDRNEDDSPQSGIVAVSLVCGDERQHAVIDWAWQARSGQAHPYRAQLEWSGTAIDVAADDMFEALVRIREQLEPQGWFVAVQGSRLDTFPSAMQRDMAGGLNVNVLRMGEPVPLEDVVETFAEADPSTLATVAAQRQNVEEWCRSVDTDTKSER